MNRWQAAKAGPIFAVLAAFLFQPVQASLAASPATIIILDGSGSMWSKIAGKTKFAIARAAVEGVVSTLPPGQQVGLMAYGHRRRGDCADIELLVPPASDTAAAIRKAVGEMRFLGKTPISAALRQAAEALRHTEEAATIVLVTDGLETCEADPCAVASELKASGIDFKVHVVGFGLKADEATKLACVAANTGGFYIAADDAGTLTKALTETVAATRPASPPPPAAPGPGTLVLYTEPGFKGLTATLDKDVHEFINIEMPDGDTMNDRTFSLKAHGRWEVCMDSNYVSDCRVVEGEVADLGEAAGQISSARYLGPK